jgi:hypothetical protein
MLRLGASWMGAQPAQPQTTVVGVGGGEVRRVSYLKALHLALTVNFILLCFRGKGEVSCTLKCTEAMEFADYVKVIPCSALLLRIFFVYSPTPVIVDRVNLTLSIRVRANV